MSEDYQRSSDPRIDKIETSLVEIVSRQDSYESAQVEQRTMLGRIAVALEGKPIKDIRGFEVGGREPGLIQKVDELSETATANNATLELLDNRTNGGTTVTTNLQHEWTRGQKIALGGVLTTLFFSALPGIVILARWIVEVSNS